MTEPRKTTEAARQAVYDADFQRQMAVQLRDRPAANLETALDAFETAIRAEYSELVEAALAAAQLAEDIAAHIDDLGGSGGDTVRTIATDLRAALAAIEQEGRS